MNLYKKEVEVSIKKPGNSVEEEIQDLKLKLDSVVEMLTLIRKASTRRRTEVLVDKKEGPPTNKDGIPLNSSFIGFTKSSQYPYVLIVDADGLYRVGAHKFASLSASAEFASKVRRSGWTFWKLMDGRSLKEVYRKPNA